MKAVNVYKAFHIVAGVLDRASTVSPLKDDVGRVTHLVKTAHTTTLLL